MARAIPGVVFVTLADPLRRQPLKIHQIEFRRVAEEAGEQGVDLPTVMGLVVETMRQCRGELLLELLRR
jgi:hypothetical protein